MFDLKRFRKDNDLTQAEFAAQFGVTQGFISQVEGGLSPLPRSIISKILAKKDYILHDGDIHALKEIDQEIYGSTPLIPISAMAGYSNGDVSVKEYEIIDHYVIPDFLNRGVKFLIRASGSSMYPKYSNGDLLACRPITDITFFQWGKVYVLDTDQGPLVKRLYPSKNNELNIECRSDNKEQYPPFDIPKNSIRKISIVVGVIRFE